MQNIAHMLLSLLILACVLVKLFCTALDRSGVLYCIYVSLYLIALCFISLYYIIILCYILLCPIILRYTILLRFITLYHIILCNITLYSTSIVIAIVFVLFCIENTI